MSSKAVSVGADVGLWLQGLLNGPLASRRARLTTLGAGLGLSGLIGLWLYYRQRRREEAAAEKEEEERREAERSRTRASTRNRYSSLNGPTRHRLQGHSLRHSESLNDGASAKSPELLVCAGIDALAEVVRVWERALESGQVRGKLVTEAELYEGLQDALLRCRAVQSQISQVAEKHNLAMGTGEGSIASTSILAPTSTGPDYHPQPLLDPRRTMSLLSDESFVSALEELIPEFESVDILGREELALEPEALKLYQDALRVVDSVPCRLSRADFLGCESDEEFLAKLHCVRRAFNVLTAEEGKRAWLVETGRALMVSLLTAAGAEEDAFERAFAALLEWLGQGGAIEAMEEELRGRRVPKISFYDVVLDFILMDAFEDLAQPPSAVFAVTQNRFLSASFKQATLRTVVSSVLRSKRARLSRSDGFLAHFYDVSEAVSPSLAWGFLGSDQNLRELCYFFKDQVCTFCTDIFSFHRVRYTNLHELSNDVWLILQRRLQIILQRLEPSAQP